MRKWGWFNYFLFPFLIYGFQCSVSFMFLFLIHIFCGSFSLGILLGTCISMSFKSFGFLIYLVTGRIQNLGKWMFLVVFLVGRLVTSCWGLFWVCIIGKCW